MSSSKKLICLSWCDADDVVNYGQILQGCAMMYNLRKYYKGTICYISFNLRGIRGITKYYINHYNIWNGHFFSYLKTKKVINDFIKLYNIEFHQVTRKKEIETLAMDSYIAICGSDQIWHPMNYQKEFFLNFQNDNIIRCSYAASLPKKQIEEQYQKEFEYISNDLKKFNYISIREKLSVDFIKKLSGKNVISVLDPTFLVPKRIWENIIEDMHIDEKFIFVYIPNGMDSQMDIYIRKLQEKTGISNLRIMMTRGENKFKKEKTMKFVSIGEFLYLIKNASYVVTSSFHAVVFSVIFHKNFFCYDVPNPIRGEDLRMSSILEILNCTSRLLNNENDILNSVDIDYEKIDQILEIEISNSNEYLEKILSL